jgi:hypothetical protein
MRRMQCEPLHISLQFPFVLVGDRPLDCLAEARWPVVTISTCIKSGPRQIPHKLSDPAPPAASRAEKTASATL